MITNISPEYGAHLIKENQILRKTNRQLEEDNAFLKKCLYAALKRTGSSLLLDEDFEASSAGEFRFDYNVSDQPILKIVMGGKA